MNIKINKKVLLSSAMVLAVSASVCGQNNQTYHMSDIDITREHGLIKVRMDVNPRDYKLKYNQRLEVIPTVRSLESADTLELPSITIAGTNAYYDADRSGSYKGTLLRSGHGERFEYTSTAPWQDWMDHSRVEFKAVSTGCCGVPNGPVVEEPIADLDWRPMESMYAFNYVAPAAEYHKQRRIEGKAYINFPVNRTEIFPDYMVNPQELRKITGSIDSVRLDKDANVKSITLTGFASPEGPYANNVRLASGRTEALKEYVRKQYTFPAEVFHTSYVPEDWEGLRDSVAASNLSDRAEILEFIDNGNINIEKRNDELRKRFPKSYAYLLKNVYPSLRHTNYAIDYDIRVYTDVNEILRVFKEKPENLSLNEFFVAANAFQVGSKEYDEVFEKAVLYYPNDETACLNAANSAMNSGDYARAAMLLGKAGESANAIYGRAVLDAKTGKLKEAESGFAKASEMGVKDADKALETVRRAIAGRKHVTFIK